MTPPIDLDELRRCEGQGRNVLEARIRLLCDLCDRTHRNALAATDNLLTAVQARCSELLEQRRCLAARIESLAAADPAQRDSLIAAALTAARGML